LGIDEAMDGSGVDDNDEEAEMVLLASPVMMSDDGGELAPLIVPPSIRGMSLSGESNPPITSSS
jgi:hypothetical protein